MSMERLDGFTADGHGNVIPGDIVDGDVVRIDGHTEKRYYAPVAPTPQPMLLSKTAFQDLSVAHLGAGMTGMARFQAIMDACAGGSGAIKFCFSRYEAAQTFEKTQVANFTAIMVAAAIMTQAEADAILNNWPTQ